MKIQVLADSGIDTGRFHSPHNVRMETDVPKSRALCKEKSTMRAFSARGSRERYASCRWGSSDLEPGR